MSSRSLFKVGLIYMAILSFFIGFLFFEVAHVDKSDSIENRDVQMTIAAASGRVTKWKGVSENWNDITNWDAGVPDESTDVLISVGSSGGKADPVVPAPSGSSVAGVRNLTVQSGGKLTFALAPNPGVLIVHGNEKLQNDGIIVLGEGNIIFKNKITFMQGGTFDAGSGTLEFEGVVWDNKPGATFTAGTSTVILTGSGDQTVSGNITFYNLEVSTAGTVTLAGSITVTNQATINEGATLDVPEGSTLSIEGAIVNNGEVTGSGTVTVQGQPLPVQMSSFTVTSLQNGVELRWRTETEVNNYGFEIQRRSTESRADARGYDSPNEWKTIGFVQGAGTSTSPREYSYVDAGLAPGRYAYRIKQIDNNGTFSIHNTAEVEVGVAPKELALDQNYPNPFNPSTNITFSVPTEGRAIVRIFDTQGREVSILFNDVAMPGRIYQATFDASGLATGVYLSSVEFGGQRLVRKMIFLK